MQEGGQQIRLCLYPSSPNTPPFGVPRLGYPLSRKFVSVSNPTRRVFGLLWKRPRRTILDADLHTHASMASLVGRVPAALLASSQLVRRTACPSPCCRRAKPNSALVARETFPGAFQKQDATSHLLSSYPK